MSSPRSLLPDLEPGDPRAIGPYRLLGRLGSGGMGVVYAGVDATGRRTAVKVIRTEYADAPEFRSRFGREVALLRRVRAACVAPVLAAGDQDGRPWYAAPFLPGRTLADHVAARGPLAPGQARALALGLAEALSAIHAQGVVHRDLKPGNVILAPEGPRVVDFGIARAADESGITRTGELVGTPGWLAPEAYGDDPAAVGPALDVFAWGALVAFAATGRRPFGTGGVPALTRRVLTAEPDLAGLPPELREPVAAALCKKPEPRPDAPALFHRLARLCGERTAASDPGALVGAVIRRHWDGLGEAAGPDWAPALRRSRRQHRSRRLLALGGAAAVLLAAATGGAALHSYRTTGEIRPGEAESAIDSSDPAAPGPGGHRTGREADERLVHESGCAECLTPVETFTGLEHGGEPARVVAAESVRPHPETGAETPHLVVFLVRERDDEVVAHNHGMAEPNGMTLNRDFLIRDLYFVDPANHFGLLATSTAERQGDTAHTTDSRIGSFNADSVEQVQEFGAPLASVAASSGPVQAADLDGNGVYEIGAHWHIGSGTWLLVHHKWDPTEERYRPWMCAESTDHGETYTEPAALYEEPCRDYGNIDATS